MKKNIALILATMLQFNAAFGWALNKTGRFVTPDSIKTGDILDGEVKTGDIEDLAVSTSKLGVASVTTSKVDDLAITTDKIDNGAITTEKLSPGAVTASALSDGSITTTKLGTDAVTASSILTDSVTNTKVQDGAISTAKLATDSVTDASILTAEIKERAIESGAVTTAKLGADAVTNAKLINGAVTSDKISAGAISTAKLVGAAVTTTKLSGGAVTSAAILEGAATTGKLGDDSVTTAKLINGAVTSNKIVSGAVTTAKLIGAAVTTEKISGGAVTAAAILTGAVTTGKLGTDSVTTEKLITDAVDAEKLADNAVDTAAIQDGAISTAKLGADSVSESKILTAAVTVDKIGTGAVTTGKIGADAVTEIKILNEAVTTAKLAGGAVTTTKLSAGAVTSATILEGAVATGKLGTDAVTNAKLINGAITSNKISAGAVSTGKLQTDSVTSDKLLTGAVTTSKLGTDSVSASKLIVDSDGLFKVSGSAMISDGSNITIPAGNMTIAGTLSVFETITAATTTIQGGQGREGILRLIADETDNAADNAKITKFDNGILDISNSADASGHFVISLTGNIGFGDSSPTEELVLSRDQTSAVVLRVENADNTDAGADARLVAQVGGASGGDAYALFSNLAGVSWSAGMSNAADDAFVIAEGAALETNPRMFIGVGGAVTYVSSTTNQADALFGGFLNIQGSGSLLETAQFDNTPTALTLFASLDSGTAKNILFHTRNTGASKVMSILDLGGLLVHTSMTVIGNGSVGGNFGIGIDDAAHTLEIAQGASQVDFELAQYAVGATFPFLDLLKSDSDTVGTLAETDPDDVLGKIRIRNVNEFTTKADAAVISSTQIAACSGGVCASNLMLQAMGSSALIEKQLVLSFNGGIGISTSIPSHQLTIGIDGVANANAFAITETDSQDLVWEVTRDATKSQLSMFDATVEGIRLDPSTGVDSFILGELGVGLVAPDVQFHVLENGASGLSFPASVVMVVQRDGSAGNGADLAIIAGGSGVSGVNFGDLGDVDRGRIAYSHSGDSMTFTTNATLQMTLDNAGNLGLGELIPVRDFHISNAGTTFIRGERTSGTGDSLIIVGAGEAAVEGAQIRFNSLSIANGQSRIELHTHNGSGLSEVVRITNSRHIATTGSTPAPSSCGTTPSITGSDISGKVTIGATASSTCTLTFATAYAAAPACVVTNGTIDVPVFATTTTTTLVLTDGAGDFSDDIISYICMGTF